MPHRRATRRRIGMLALITLIVVGWGSELWIHTQFGINLPWATPRFLLVCNRRYDQGPAARNPETTYTFYVRPTVFDLPVPVPDVSPVPGIASWGGCPQQVILQRDQGDVVYGAIQGGP